jgi:PAS domain S-box-containing protein
MLSMAEQQASLEIVNISVERKIVERTAELTREIAERQRADEARRHLSDQLARERKRVMEILNNVPAIVFEHSMVDDAGCRFVNQFVEKMLGFTPEEWMADPEFWRSRVHPEDREKLPELVSTQFTPETNFSTVYRWVTKDGRVVWGETYVTPATDGNGNITGIRGVTVDITERKNAEAELARMNLKLLSASRHSGMAEVATNVLHNVGNVLNSVNISHAVVSDQVRKSGIANLTQVVRMINEHGNDLGAFLTQDPVGRKLPQFLEKLSSWLEQEQSATLTELGTLGKSIEHMKQIITTQQSYAMGGVHETVPVEDLAESAIQITGVGLPQHRIEIVREYGELPMVNMEKDKVMQILVNLLSNARHAIVDTDCPDRRIVVSTSREDQRINIAVHDTGVGIEPENLQRVFEYGFTTKKDGHGFGLNSSQIAAREMGAEIIAESPGIGKGATFTLKLPLRQ